MAVGRRAVRPYALTPAFHMIALDMRKLTTFLAVAAGIIAAAASCGDDGGDNATPVAGGPTSLSISKSFERGGNGEFTFTVSVSNDGDNAAVLFVLSDVWADGLEVTSLGDFGETAVEPIDDRGFEALVDEFASGRSAEIEYQARCVRSGQWTNTATISAGNAEPATTSVSVSCP